MKHGNWIPISKAFIKDLPHGRPYTRLEAAYSIQCDYDQNNSVTVAGYSALWDWSRTRVSKFLNDMNVEIKYPEKTKKRRNQKGHIAIHKQDIKETYKEHIRLIENSTLEEDKNIKKTKKKHKKDIKGSTTKEPNPNPNKFTKPTIQEISNYCLERKNNINADHFFNYYETRGWKLKTGIMKDWKACVRTWEQNTKQKTYSANDISTEDWF